MGVGYGWRDMKTVFTLALAALVAASAFGQTTSKVLVLGIKARLEKILKAAYIPAESTVSEPGRLKMSYLTKEFVVFVPSMLGQPAYTRKDVGPKDDGLLIEVSVYDCDRNTLSYGRQAATPPEPKVFYEGGYWRYETDDGQFIGMDRAIQYTVSWGRNVDPEVIRKLIAVLHEGIKPFGVKGSGFGGSDGKIPPR